MSKEPFISVIIPVYNVEAYLQECLVSIVNQTYSNYEVIVVDDGSTDKSAIICDDFQQQYPDLIKVIHKANGGLSSARNSGIEIASGQYIGFVDSDDFVPCDMLENLVSGFALDDNTMIVNGMIKSIDEKGQNEREMRPAQWHRDTPKIIKGKDFGVAMFEETSNHYVWSKLYDARLFDKVRFVEGRNDEDTLFAYDLAKIFRDTDFSMVEISQITYYYRRVSTSICNNIEEPYFIIRLQNLEELISASATEIPEIHVHLRKLYIKSLMWWLLMMAKTVEWMAYFPQYAAKLRGIQNKLAQDVMGRDYFSFILCKYSPTMFMKYIYLKHSISSILKPVLIKNEQ